MNFVRWPLKSISVKTQWCEGQISLQHDESKMKQKRLFDVSPGFKLFQAEVIQIITKKNPYEK